MKTVIFSALFVCLFSPFAFATDAFPYDRFDTDGIKGLNEVEFERAAYVALLHQDPLFRALDKNFDGEPDPGEFEKIIKKKKEEAKYAAEGRRQSREIYLKQNGLPVANNYEPDPKLLPQVEEIENAITFLDKRSNLQLRGNIHDIDFERQGLGHDAYLESIKDISPATFGYTLDDASSNEIWQAQGVLAMPISDDLGVSGWKIVPSAAFDRVSNGNPAGEDVDSLILRAQSHLIPPVSGGNGPLAVDDLEIRFGPEYATNFNFDDGILGGSLEIEPTLASELLGNGGGRQIGNSGIGYGTYNFIRIEGGGSSTGEVASSDYLRIGPSVGAKLYYPFSPIENPLYSLNLNYSYLADTLDSDDFDRFSAAFNWHLDRSGHMTLTAKYDEGKIPLSLQEINLFSLSLGIRF